MDPRAQVRPTIILHFTCFFLGCQKKELKCKILVGCTWALGLILASSWPNISLLKAFFTKAPTPTPTPTTKHTHPQQQQHSRQPSKKPASQPAAKPQLKAPLQGDLHPKGYQQEAKQQLTMRSRLARVDPHWQA